jgi:hypothetical protein
MKVLRAMFAGIGGALAMSLGMFIMRTFGLNVSLERILGSMFPPDLPLPAWWAGFLVHLLVGAVAGLVYAFIFEVAVQRSGVVMGAAIGFAHGMLAGLIMSAIPAMNPLDPNAAGAPGAFLSNMTAGPVVFLLLHCLFGAVTGLAYGPTVQKSGVVPEGEFRAKSW